MLKSYNEKYRFIFSNKHIMKMYNEKEKKICRKRTHLFIVTDHTYKYSRRV